METPSIEKIINGNITIDDIKYVDVNDILGREVVKPIKSLLTKNIQNKIVLVTGGGGSIGKELCRQIYALGPAKLIVVDNSEFNLYSITNELGDDENIIPKLCDINDLDKIKIILMNIKLKLFIMLLLINMFLY